MLTSIQGVYRDGKIELNETPPDAAENAPVIVTFLPCDCESGAPDETANPAPYGTDLRAMGIDAETAGRIRASLLHFAEEWDTPEMEAYNDYEVNKAKFLSER